MKTLMEVFGTAKPIIAMIHLAGCGAEEKLTLAKREIEILYRNGVHAVLVENYYGGASDVEMVLKYLQEAYPHKVYGVNILGSEVVGLIPQQALVDCAEYYLQLEDFRGDQVLESRL